jgi:hypothetical protein
VLLLLLLLRRGAVVSLALCRSSERYGESYIEGTHDGGIEVDMRQRSAMRLSQRMSQR